MAHLLRFVNFTEI